jgi:hypothetical protein
MQKKKQGRNAPACDRGITPHEAMEEGAGVWTRAKKTGGGGGICSRCSLFVGCFYFPDPSDIRFEVQGGRKGAAVCGRFLVPVGVRQ